METIIVFHTLVLMSIFRCCVFASPCRNYKFYYVCFSITQLRVLFFYLLVLILSFFVFPHSSLMLYRCMVSCSWCSSSFSSSPCVCPSCPHMYYSTAKTTDGHTHSALTIPITFIVHPGLFCSHLLHFLF